MRFRRDLRNPAAPAGALLMLLSTLALVAAWRAGCHAFGKEKSPVAVAPKRTFTGPEWWTGAPKAAAKAAEARGRWLVLYFHSASSMDCRRMSTETWPFFDATKLSPWFIWLKFDPLVDVKFSDFYEVHRGPEFVILDDRIKERARIVGFVDASELTAMLQTVLKQGRAEGAGPRKRTVMFPGGTAMDYDEYRRSMRRREADEIAGTP